MVSTKLNPWWLAVKPGSLPKVLAPIAVGQCLGYAVAGAVEPAVVLLSLFVAICAQLSIVLLNDYADREADAAHARRFPELLDPRVLVEGLLQSGQVLGAGFLAALGVLASSAALWALYDRPYALYLGLAGLGVFWAYSFSPIRLNYRGGGEALEMLGVGVLLPVTGYYICTGVLPLADGHLLAPVLLYALVGALASGLKHEPADSENGKRTCCVLFGAQATRKAIWMAQMAARLWCGVFFLTGEYGHFALVLGALLPAAPMFVTRRFDAQADYRDLAALSRYKQSLIQAGYLNSIALALDFAF
jgi:1,4-dihydroxy-2-naphthoate octaprenyltransferase/chlorophyll synthase